MSVATGEIPETRVWHEKAERLNPSEKDMADRHTGGADLPTMAVWPNWRDEDGLRLVGWCPFCGHHHQHCLSTDPVRHSDCSHGAGQYRLIVRDEPLPLDLAFAITHEAPDLRTASLRVQRSRFEIVSGLHSARRTFRKKHLDRRAFAEACRALVASGVFDERAAMQGDEADQAQIQRSLIARHIASQGPGRWRVRLARALDAAFWWHARGELAQ